MARAHCDSCAKLWQIIKRLSRENTLLKWEVYHMQVSADVFLKILAELGNEWSTTKTRFMKALEEGDISKALGVLEYFFERVFEPKYNALVSQAMRMRTTRGTATVNSFNLLEEVYLLAKSQGIYRAAKTLRKSHSYVSRIVKAYEVLRPYREILEPADLPLSKLLELAYALDSLPEDDRVRTTFINLVLRDEEMLRCDTQTFRKRLREKLSYVEAMFGVSSAPSHSCT